MAAEKSVAQEDTRGADLVQALGSKYSAEILGATGEPRSAQELSNRLEVPIATCYRRIEDLTEVGLLELEESVLSDDNRQVEVYRRGVDELTVGFGDENFEVEMIERTRAKTSSTTPSGRSPSPESL
jgi:predicted transcriptional regulator